MQATAAKKRFHPLSHDVCLYMAAAEACMLLTLLSHDVCRYMAAAEACMFFTLFKT